MEGCEHPLIDLEEGKRGMMISEAAQRSLKTGKAVELSRG